MSGRTPEEIERERLEILEERENLTKKYEEDEAKLRAELAKSLSVKDRLMRRQKAETIKVTLQDDLGDFAVETRLMTTEEIKRALELDELFTSGDPERFMEAVEGYSEILDDICVTPGLGEGFWTSPGCPAEPAVMVAIVMRAAIGSADIGRRVKSFRGHG